MICRKCYVCRFQHLTPKLYILTCHVYRLVFPRVPPTAARGSVDTPTSSAPRRS
jgi:hypothetical protein